MFFARVLGWDHVYNYTDAVARATIPEVKPWFNGNALVSTMMHCPPPGYPHDPFTVMGNSGTVITNSGILVNSDCKFPDAFTQNGSSTVKTDKGVCVAGDYSYKTGAVNPPPTGPSAGCKQIDPSMFTLPNPSCSHLGEIKEIKSKEYIAYPGLYGPNFNFDSISDKTPAGTLRLAKGIYCFYDGIDFQSTWNITTDASPINNKFDPLTEGVFFFVPKGDVTFNGSSYVDVYAIPTTAEGFPKEYVNYLMYIPPTNDATVKITGSNGSNFTGTILAPQSYIVLNGGTGTVGLDAQVIGYAVTIEGSGTLDLTYNKGHNAVTTTNPGIEATK
jgi:hypothetical protein